MVELIFLEAADEVLVRRFSESRRPHPMCPQAPVLDGVHIERERLQELRQRADRIVDTSHLNVHELKDYFARQYLGQDPSHRLAIALLTFGFKFGVPYDVDLMFDVRFLRNPYFVPELKGLTGEDPKVMAYVLNDAEAETFLDHLNAMLRFLIPLYERERRSNLTIAIGCTGGRHRSVAIAARLRDDLKTCGYDADLRHRDVRKP